MVNFVMIMTADMKKKTFCSKKISKFWKEKIRGYLIKLKMAMVKCIHEYCVVQYM
jgi:hypothetical protein